jgi:glucose 1-dehydrogenase
MSGSQSEPRARPRARFFRVLEGQKALVTGAGSGIGAAVAIGLAQAGAAVAVNYRSRAEEAEAIVRTIRDAGGAAIAVQADVAREDDVERMFRDTIGAFGTLDILVANAGLQQDAAFTDMSLAQWQKVMEVNLQGQFLCARAAVREFRRRGVVPEVSAAAGKIICMSSVHDLIPWAGHVNYASSKGGVLLMMKSLAQEVAPERIRVNGISPGAIRTGINEEAWSTEEAYRDLMRLIPYKRIGEPEDVAQAAVWLVSDAADYVTGITLYVDGGMTLYPEFAHGG